FGTVIGRRYRTGAGLVDATGGWLEGRGAKGNYSCVHLSRTDRRVRRAPRLACHQPSASRRPAAGATQTVHDGQPGDAGAHALLAAGESCPVLEFPGRRASATPRARCTEGGGRTSGGCRRGRGHLARMPAPGTRTMVRRLAP